MSVAPATVLHTADLRVTKQRIAVMSALAGAPHSDADAVLSLVRDELGKVSTQGVYDVLNTLTRHGILRRFQPSGTSAALYEVHTGDNHHHMVCRRCESVTDVDCATGSAPCIEVEHVEPHSPEGFVIDEAEVIFWGTCAACRDPLPPHQQTTSASQINNPDPDKLEEQ